MTKYRALIADDHSVVRQGISILLKESFDDIEITHCSTFTDVLTILNTGVFDLVILDISIPEGKGVQMLPLIHEFNSDIMVLVFSAYEEELYGLRYLNAGASGYVNKLSSDQEFIGAVTAMRRKQKYFSTSTLEKASQDLGKQTDNPLSQLSPREMEIAKLMIQGEGNLEIANKLNLQNSTVSTYKNRIFEKLDINNTVALFEIFKTYNEEYDI